MTAYIKSNGENFNFDTGAVDKEFSFNTGATEVAVIDKRGVTDTAGKSLRTVDNLLINGNFDVWQRSDSHNSDGIGSADRWIKESAVVSTDFLRSFFLLGQTEVPGDPQNYCRLYTGTGGASNSYSYMSQKIEAVRRFNAKTLKGSFWAKTALDGQKCSLSWNVYTDSAFAGDSLQEFTLTDEWARYEFSFDIYSLSGKGNVANNSVADYFELKWWFDVGSSFASEGGGIGNQEGSFRIAKAEAYLVDTANSDLEYEVNRRTFVEDFGLCRRFYEKSYDFNYNPGDAVGNGCRLGVAARNMASGFWFDSVNYKVTKRIPNGICLLYSPSGAVGKIFHDADRSAATLYISTNNFMVKWDDDTSGTDGQFFRYHWTLDAEFTT